MEKHFLFFNNNFDTALQLCFLKNIERKHFTSADLEFKLLFHARLCLKICWFPAWVTGSCIAGSQCCDWHLHCSHVVAVAVLRCCSHRPAPIFLGVVWIHNKIGYLAQSSYLFMYLETAFSTEKWQSTEYFSVMLSPPRVLPSHQQFRIILGKIHVQNSVL